MVEAAEEACAADAADSFKPFESRWPILSTKRGPSEDRGVLVGRILDVARDSFANLGWAGTTMRAVAIAAEVDPRLVTYYFSNKTALLEACLQPPTGYLDEVRKSMSGPLRTRGRAMVANMLRYWEDPETARVIRAIILTAMHEPVALDRLKAIYRTNIVAGLAASLDDEQREIRANLAASHIIGVSMTRYIYSFEPIASMSADDVLGLVAPTVQRLLTGPLPSTT